MSEWTYYEASQGSVHGAAHRTGGTLEGVVVVLSCIALEFLVVALAVGFASLEASLAARRGARCSRRRGVQRRLDALHEIDARLDAVWSREVDSRRRQAARDAARLISNRVPLVDVRFCGRGPGECCAQLVFADGTRLALWSNSSAIEHKLHQLGPRAVLKWASRPDCGDLEFGTETKPVLINGELLAAA